MKLTILSYSAESFKDRDEAGVELGKELYKRVRGERPLVLGIPRGGLVTAAAISSVFDCDIDIMLTHKIGAPYNPELAIGAVSEDGRVYVNDYWAEATGTSAAYIENERKRQLEELKRRRKLFRSVYPKIPLKGRTVIVTDDGIATGATVQAALWAARQERPEKLIGAFPVAPVNTLRKLGEHAHEIICLRAPETFGAISQFYFSFPQVSDEEVLNILRQESERRQMRERKCAHH